MKQTIEYLKSHLSEINVPDDTLPFYDSLDRVIDDLEFEVELTEEIYQKPLSRDIGIYAMKDAATNEEIEQPYLV